MKSMSVSRGSEVQMVTEISAQHPTSVISQRREEEDMTHPENPVLFEASHLHEHPGLSLPPLHPNLLPNYYIHSSFLNFLPPLSQDHSQDRIRMCTKRTWWYPCCGSVEVTWTHCPRATSRGRCRRCRKVERTIYHRGRCPSRPRPW